MDEATSTLLELGDGDDGDIVDYKGRQVSRSTSGGWKSASFIIGVEVAERFVYYGISSNLISYLTGPLGESVATAAANVNVWNGTAALTPLLAAFIADSFLGRYATIIIASLLYLIGVGFLSLSAVLPFSGYHCKNTASVSACSPPRLQVIFFFFSLYLVAIAQGGHKPCVQAFGADQFDSRDPNESKAKSSFFNWWYCCLNASIMFSVFILSYIQDNVGWGLGFGIPCIVMIIALVVFLLGTITYRFRIKEDKRSPFVRIGNVFIKAARNWRTDSATLAVELEARGALTNEHFNTLKFLNKALLAPVGSNHNSEVPSLNDVEEAKAILRLIPIGLTCLGYSIVFAQPTTLFTKQGVTMDRHIGSNFEIPPASLQAFVALSIVVSLPIYDRILVPTTRAITRKPSGITMLQRIGTGMFLSLLCMTIAALVEKKRLQTAMKYGLVDKPNATVPMSVSWLLPQYLLFGISEAFTMVGLQEFFYDQVPVELRSIGLSLYLCIFGTGSFLSGFLISVIERLTNKDDRDGWFSDNLNRAHLNYFYWLLAGISALAFLFYLYFAKFYVYNRLSSAP